MGNIDPNKMQFIADRSSWKNDIKTVQGNRLLLVATRTPRNPRKYKTVYIYHIENTRTIVFNRSRNGVFFMVIAVKPGNMKRFYETFVMPPITEAEKKFLELYDYQLIA